jgi:hypothetical protein
VDVLPEGFLQRDPVPVCPQAPLEEPVRLVLLGRDQPDDVLAQALGNGVGVEVGGKAVLVLLAGELPDVV